MRRLIIVILAGILITIALCSCGSTHQCDAYGMGKQGNVVGYNRMR